MSQPLQLFIDVQNRQLVRSNTSAIPTSLPEVFQGDTLSLSLRFLEYTGNTSAPYQDIDYSDASVIVAVGSIALPPAAGNFTITDTAASQTTGNIAYNASAATVQTAIQSALTTNWSTATVAGSAGGPYTITNGVNGAKTALIGTSVSLTPVASVIIGDVQDGTADLPSILYLRLSQNPIALQGTWTAADAPTATVTELQHGSGTQNEIQQITLGNNPYAGAFVVNFGSQTSAPIQWNATAAAVQTTLQAMSSIGSGNCSVGGQAGAWVVTFTGSKALAAQALMTTVATGLVGPKALTGELSLNTAGIEEAIGEQGSISQTFEIKVTPNGENPFTVYQGSITINNDLIVGAPAIPAPGVSYYTSSQADARYVHALGANLSPLASITSGSLNLAHATNTTSGLVKLDSSGNLVLNGQFSLQGGNFTSSTDGVGNFLTLSSADTYYQLQFANSSTAETWNIGPYWPGSGSPFGFFNSALNSSPLSLFNDGHAEFTSNVIMTGSLSTDAATITSDGSGNLTAVSFTGSGAALTDVLLAVDLNSTVQGHGQILDDLINNGVTFSTSSEIDFPSINISATSFIGDGSSLTGLTFSQVATTHTFTLSSGSATVSDSSITADSVIVCTVKTVSGTRAGTPDIVPNVGVGFTATGGGSDNSTYNYIVLN